MGQNRNFLYKDFPVCYTFFISAKGRHYMKASICTLGCRVNQYESEAISESLQAKGFTMVPYGEESDVVIINTCTVTGESDRKSRQLIRRAACAAPDAAIIVTGCFAQVAPDAAASLGADAVVGNGDKGQIPDIAYALVQGGCFEGAVSDIQTAAYDNLRINAPRRARSYIKIEDGCENRCAYCIIPAARGRVRSKPAARVIEEASVIASTGCCEVILTGIETGSYGRDLENMDLETLLEQVDCVPGIRRIALGSLDPTVLRPSFVERAAALTNLLPHFHLSVQSGCTQTLNRMRRRYTAEKVLENMARAREKIPGLTFSADMIAGFPGETEADFLETVAFCKKAEFLHVHIFPYSVRKGTEAAGMPDQIAPAEKRRRSTYLANVQKEVQAGILDRYIDAHRIRPVYVLAEKWEQGITTGHTEHFVPCEIPTERDCTGQILSVYPVGKDGCTLKGKI